MKQSLRLIFSFVGRLDFGIKLIGMLIVFVGIIIVLDYDRSKYNKVIDQNDLIELDGTLKYKPYISENRTGRSLTIYLIEYPDYAFLLRTWRFAAFKSVDFINDCKVGDSVKLAITKHDYATKIAHSEKLQFSEKIRESSLIEPYSVDRGGFEYLTFRETANAFVEDTDRTTWFVKFISAAIIILIVIYGILKLTGGIGSLKKWFPTD